MVFARGRAVICAGRKADLWQGGIVIEWAVGFHCFVAQFIAHPNMQVYLPLHHGVFDRDNIACCAELLHNPLVIVGIAIANVDAIGHCYGDIFACFARNIRHLRSGVPNDQRIILNGCMATVARNID